MCWYAKIFWSKLSIMGNKASVATIFVSFDKQEVFPGETVHGKAFLSVVQEDISCVSIGCRLLGQESAKVIYHTHSGSGKNRKTHTHVAHEQRSFLNHTFCLQSVPSGNIRRGQYEYPFQFTVPPGSPASVHVARGRNRCDVDYSMEVWLDRPGMLRWDIRHRQRITVRTSVPPGPKTPLYMEPSSYPMVSMCCIGRGTVVLGGSAESCVLYAGEPTSVKYAAKNNGTVPIKAIEVSVTEFVHFSARGHHSSTSATLFHKRIEAGDACLDLAPQQGPLSLDDAETLRMLNSLLQSDSTKVPFTIPPSARSTYNGAIIRITHVFSIRAITTFGTANPTISRELVLYSKAPVQDAVEEGSQVPLPALPAGWAPVVATAVVVPETRITAAVAYEEHDDNKPVVYPSAPTEVYPAVMRFTSSAQLIQALQNTYDPCGELDKYIRQGNQVDALLPEEFFGVFKAVNDVFDQLRLADILASHLTSISCVKVARAAAGAKDMCRRDVVEKLLTAGPLTDPQEVQVLKQQLSAFEFMTVEKYIH